MGNWLSGDYLRAEGILNVAITLKSNDAAAYGYLAEIYT
jgi:hypothetical protein